MIKSAEEFIKLRYSDIPEEQERATFEEAPIEIWLDVIKNYPDAKEWVIYNKKIQLEILNLLSLDEDPDVRYWVASKNSITEDLLKHFAKDPDEPVRRRVAVHKKSTREILEILKNDNVEDIRERVNERLKSGNYKKES